MGSDQGSTGNHESVHCTSWQCTDSKDRRAMDVRLALYRGMQALGLTLSKRPFTRDSRSLGTSDWVTAMSVA